MKAKFICAYTFQHKRYLEYEYRGQRYDVCAEWNAENIGWQHKQQQDFIDRQLDTKCKSTENAQAGFDLFWELVNEE